MNMESVTSILNSADGPTSIFVAAKSPVITGVMIACVVVGVIMALFGLKLVRVISAIVGLIVGAGAGVAIAIAAGLNTTLSIAVIAVCGIVLCVLCAALRKFGIFVMTFCCSFATFLMLIESEIQVVLIICAVVSLILAILTVVFAEFLVIFVTGIVGGVEAGMILPFLLGMTKVTWIGYVLSLAIAVIGIVIQTMMQSRKIGRKEKIFSKKIKEEVSMESEVEKARMWLEEDESEEEEMETTENEDDVASGTTVTEIFDIDDLDAKKKDNLDSDEIERIEIPEPEEGYLDDDDDIEIFETGESGITKLDDID